jgi:cytochrome c biogenesis protein
MTAKKQKNVIQRIWDFFISVRLTIVLLIILSGVCVIGTLIPQNESPQHYLQLYSQSTYRLFAALGFLQLFASWWFFCLMTVFTINLAACSLNRLPRVWRAIFHGDTVLDDKLLQGLSNVRKFSLKKFPPEQLALYESAIARCLAKPVRMQEQGNWHLFSESGRFTRFGFYLTHLGLIIIIFGSMSGSLGFQGYMQIAEGQTAQVMQLKNSNEIRKLDFAIRCDKFEVTYYDGSQRPKDYKSLLTVIDNNREVVTKTIEVNDPLVYRGIYFYQSSYGASPDSGGRIQIGVTQKETGKRQDLTMEVGGSAAIAGTGYTVRADEFLADFSMDNNGKPLSKSQEFNNPAVHVTILKDGKEAYNKWIFAKFPDFHGKGDQPLELQLVNFEPRYYTGLQVTYDPGVLVVWLGCIFLIGGIYVAFFTSHRRIWLRVEENKGEFKAVLAGSTNKNHIAFSREFEALFKSLKA